MSTCAKDLALPAGWEVCSRCFGEGTGWAHEHKPEKTLPLSPDKVLMWCICSVLPPIAGDSAKKGRDVKGKEAPEARLPALDRQGKYVPVGDTDLRNDGILCPCRKAASALRIGRLIGSLWMCSFWDFLRLLLSVLRMTSSFSTVLARGPSMN